MDMEMDGLVKDGDGCLYSSTMLRYLAVRRLPVAMGRWPDRKPSSTKIELSPINRNFTYNEIILSSPQNPSRRTI